MAGAMEILGKNPWLYKTREDIMIITKDVLKREIDSIEEEYIGILYDIIKAFKRPARHPRSTRPLTQDQWDDFLEEFAGSFADAPLNRGSQGVFEEREPLK
ncbi:MAG: hypothetical protein GY859_21240 [Desulfobacterales bacterium]|nr:hypothetical protein [Desulfobacterales bacterium]